MTSSAHPKPHTPHALRPTLPLPTIFAWQGWRLELPHTWNPLKLEGAYDSGHALFVDLHRPRLGLRWETPRRRSVNPQKWARQAMKREIGALAAEEAREHPLPAWQTSLLYIDPDPPGRNVWIGYSDVSGRAVQIVHHVERRDRSLIAQILSSFADSSAHDARLWSVFELNCLVPNTLPLQSHRLIAGDLSFTFGSAARFITARQIAPAKLALQRRSLDGWLSDQQNRLLQRYRFDGPFSDTTLAMNERALPGRSRRARRRRRFCWMRWIPPQIITLALHDERRDRLVIVQSSHEDLATQVARTIGTLTRN